MIAILLLGAIIYGYMLAMKPHLVAILFFTITIADVNFEMGGLPLNIRAIIGLIHTCAHSNWPTCRPAKYFGTTGTK